METGVTGADVSGATTTTTTISLSVKFSGRTIPITNLSPDSTIKDFKALLQPLTNVLPRGQKLISKGKLLVDAMTLRESEITNGAKIMLMASQGLHQGDGPILKQAQSRPISRDNNADRSDKGKAKKAAVDKNRLERWKATGVIGLSECNLKAIPEEVWGDSRTSARVLDLSNNVIQEVPALIGCMNSLQKLLLDSNDISDDSVSWEALKSLKSLTVLSLNQNRLTRLSSDLGWLPSLRQLHVANNMLSSLPSELRYLPKLEVLKVNNNRITTIPPWIGDLISLIEVDLSSNLLSDLPETFSNLHNLKSLSLSNNGLKSLPSSLFKMCLMLTRLDLHNTEITMDILRQIEGWENFDERRRLKQQKKLDFRVVGSAAFDEGADKS
ncbi:putative leucine-rich repeat domain, L domain-containing protein [Rosa chinensis]|uniref:Putative leucine-rich repeat domain, L domain-containing protein n=1 Tax=Rosa chinensis TaxID=74649 RepID=A0A2P6QK93_ROSCH|nr:LRR repeats and ubiquitin-like domain-containing protein At2g30105 [Rosa chinensis]PRQ34599.1 putative leucine-rich repeat domain, L domain-containing protein [Rosa chinensis]